MNKERFECIIVNQDDKEKSSCEIFFDEEILAEIFQENNQLMLKIYRSQSVEWWEVPLLGLQQAMEMGKNSLISLNPKIHRGVSFVQKAEKATNRSENHSELISSKTPENCVDLNIQGQSELDDILTHPDAKTVKSFHRKYGGIIDIRIPEDKGVRFSIEGEFMGFVSPF